MPLEQKYTCKFGHRAEEHELNQRQTSPPTRQRCTGLTIRQCQPLLQWKRRAVRVPSYSTSTGSSWSSTQGTDTGNSMTGSSEENRKEAGKYYQMALKGHRSADCTQQQIQLRASEGTKPWELTTRSTGTPNTPNAKNTPSPTLPLIPWQQLERARADRECAQKSGSGLCARARNQKLELQRHLLENKTFPAASLVNCRNQKKHKD